MHVWNFFIADEKNCKCEQKENDKQEEDKKEEGEFEEDNKEEQSEEDNEEEDYNKEEDNEGEEQGQLLLVALMPTYYMYFTSILL